MTSVPPRHWWTVAITAVITSVAIIAAFGFFSATAWSSESAEPTITAATAATTPGLTPLPLPSATAENAPAPAPTATPAAQKIQNIVFILADDLDWATFRQVPRLNNLQAQGMTLTNLTVTDSLCCPSRVSIFRSQFVHNHQVVSNVYESGGGWKTFSNRGEEDDCLATWLHNSGVQTAFFGKYLNGYGDGAPTPKYVPPGWDRWFVPVTDGAMYRGFNYTINSNGKLITYGNQPKDLLNDVLTDKAAEYIANAKSPFFTELSLTAPHDPAPIAKRHSKSDRDVRVPRTPAYNAMGANEPTWRSGLRTMGPKRLAKFDRKWRERAQSAESIADAVGKVRAALTKAGALDSTLIVVGSDNGFHSVTRRMTPGKRTPYFEDTVVPYVLIGPGIAPGTVVDKMTSTIDLGPTFAQLLGAKTPDWTDGRSLVPFIDGTAVSDWRTGILSESLSDSKPGDPDYSTFKPPQFHALRTQHWVYVEYQDGSRELFDRTTDPSEVNNIIDTADPGLVAALQAQLTALSTCSGESCRVADSMSDAPIAVPASPAASASPSASASASASADASASASASATPSPSLS